ncbi:hypothetical protein FBEOM_12640 [Fusarium beomiforme]|uniref:F-box domain-containing protein n=1 Tax=Fusarium beomiforme TaxID=44412 RepID=A0A9P5A7R3_9HYPO|nr:hypothetical protein FBEOM_12640 [Fusarium beomiforme]
MTLSTFLNLPGEVHAQISRCLKASEMSDIILSSKEMRTFYARSYYHSLKFQGTQSELLQKLSTFVSYAEDKESTRAVFPAIKHLTIELEPGADSLDEEESQMELPRLIAKALEVLQNLQGMRLDLWWLPEDQEDELCNRIAELPVWKSFRSLQMASDAEPKLLAALAGIPFELPAVPAGNLASTTNHVRNNSRIFLEFPRLEWLVLGQVEVPDGQMDPVRADPKLLVRDLLNDLEKLEHLERLALRLEVALLSNLSQATEAEMMRAFRQIADYVFKRLPALKQVALVDAEDDEDEDLTVFRGVKKNGGIEFSIERNCDRHAFPLGILY